VGELLSIAVLGLVVVGQQIVGDAKHRCVNRFSLHRCGTPRACKFRSKQQYRETANRPMPVRANQHRGLTAVGAGCVAGAPACFEIDVAVRVVVVVSLRVSEQCLDFGVL